MAQTYGLCRQCALGQFSSQTGCEMGRQGKQHDEKQTCLSLMRLNAHALSSEHQRSIKAGRMLPLKIQLAILLASTLRHQTFRILVSVGEVVNHKNRKGESLMLET